MKVGVIGGGINGLFISWRLSALGHQVELYEAGKVLQQTSSSSSKLLHGGIRYLEHGHTIQMVRTSHRGIGIDVPEDLEKARSAWGAYS